MEQPPTPRHSCLKCHFLMRWDRPSTGADNKMLVTQKMREDLERGVGPMMACGSNYHLACFHNVWDDANPHDSVGADLQSRLRAERGESCFFYPYTPGMFFPAAAELERRESDRREAKSDRRMAMWGTVIGLLGVILGALLTKLLS
ncbi:MAG TPA: hypothetical protein VJZ71_16665 [Phycisphaerae bacterium]|nr:hypothetical protein [Phycisphaerae bacterium]